MALNPVGRFARLKMVISPSDIPAVLIERIEFAYPGPALFSATETDEWPPRILQHLVGRGILRPAPRANALCCPGCDLHYDKPVVVRTTKTGRLAFIACDEEPDHGRVSVALQTLAQHTATLAGIAFFISELMALGPPRSSIGGAVFRLGTISGRHGRRDVSVGLDDGRLTIRVGRQRESVVRILRWTGDGATVDVAHIRRIASRKEKAETTRVEYLSDRSRQTARSRQTQIRNETIFREAKKRRADTSESWSAIAGAMAATRWVRAGEHRAVSAGTVRRIIVDMLRRERENLRSKRKPRNSPEVARSVTTRRV